MSLINEALKRTRDASYQSAAAAPAVASSYRVQSGVESSGSKSTPLITVLVAAIAVAGFVVLASRLTTRVKSLKDGFGPSAEATPVVPETKRSELQTGPSSMPVAPSKVAAPPAEPTPSTAAVDPKMAEDQLVARVMDKIKAEQAAAAPPPPEPPKLVLQGITYAQDGSEAMINGVNVREGEDIAGARVVAIDRRNVKLDFNGREIVLRMP